MRAFLDTNFLLDCVLPGRPEHGAAQNHQRGLLTWGLSRGLFRPALSRTRITFSLKQAGEARAREVVRDCLKELLGRASRPRSLFYLRLFR